MKPKTKIVIVHQPACSSVLGITRRQGATILRQTTKLGAKEFAMGFIQARANAKYEDEVDLPAGNPAFLYTELVKGEVAA
jgi:hypothetical protein